MDGNKLIIILDILGILMLTSGITLIVLAKKKIKIEKIKQARKTKKTY